MLKIKDNINLKELEKFGFEKNFIGNYEKVFKEQCSDFILISYNKEINGGFGNTETKYDTLFDLIQAGLIEKVERV